MATWHTFPDRERKYGLIFDFSQGTRNAVVTHLCECKKMLQYFLYDVTVLFNHSPVYTSADK